MHTNTHSCTMYVQYLSESSHLGQHPVHLRHHLQYTTYSTCIQHLHTSTNTLMCTHVCSVDCDGTIRAVPQCHMQHSAILHTHTTVHTAQYRYTHTSPNNCIEYTHLRDVDLVAREHAIPHLLHTSCPSLHTACVEIHTHTPHTLIHTFLMVLHVIW